MQEETRRENDEMGTSAVEVAQEAEALKILRIAAFGDESYSKEELVAEIGSSVSLNTLGIETPSTFRNNVGYIQGWLKTLKNDKRLIVSAAGRAEKAVNLILVSDTHQINTTVKNNFAAVF